MKKITLFILTIFTVATLYAAARPSLDGRAVVAETGTMPRGLFARTVGYLPGDSVTVTNPATGSTVDVLILGAIDPSEGVAILLSPEAADGLRIKPDSNVQVKLTKRSGSLDENANGSAVLSEGEDSTPESEEIAEAAPVVQKPVVEQNPPVAETPLVEETPAVAEEKPLVEETVISETPAVEEKPVVAETPVVEETPVIAKAVEEEIVSENVVEEEAEPETVYEILPPLPGAKNNKQKVVVIEGEEPAYEEAVEETPVIAEAEEPVSEKYTEEKVEPIVVAKEEPVEKEEIVEEVPTEIEAEPVVVAEEPPVEESLVEEEKAVAEENTDEYQPIVLVPAEPNPPVAEEKPAEIAKEIVEEAKPVVEEAPKVTISNDWTNYVVPSVKNLRSGSYYVQVASLGNKDNIKNFVDKYSAKYPVVLVQTSSKNAYQVMVGPLNIDEYGAIDEKFRDYGFKDAFVRKIK